jgi:putative oxidoreductase
LIAQANKPTFVPSGHTFVGIGLPKGMSNYSVTTRSRRVPDAPGIWQTIVGTEAGWGMPMLRLGLGVVFFAHGAQKMLGWWGGEGFDATVRMLGSVVATPIAPWIIIGEFFGAILLFLGFLTRFAALVVTTIMLGAISYVHAPNGFFMNWAGNQAGEGYEFHLLVIAMALALVIRGGGSASVDLTLTDIERR